MGFWVALLAEGVDRNTISEKSEFMTLSVALLAEGVDRNKRQNPDINILCSVALLAEGVDRNRSLMASANGVPRSPSSRRAWIEIS